MAGGLGLGAAIYVGASMQESVRKPLQQETADLKNEKECPECKAKNLLTAKFCSNCGFNYTKLTCSCGFQLNPNSKFCPECGKKVE